MNKRLAAVLASALLLGSLSLLGSPAANAHPGTACVAQGTAHLDDPLGLPVLTSVTTGWSITGGGLVGCSTAGGSGDVTGACGLSTGGGTVTIDGADHAMGWQSAASMLIITGEVNGVANAVANPLAGDSCASGTADDFLVTAVLVH